MENSLNVIRDIILNQGSLETVLDKMTDGFLFLDNDWMIIYWNRSAERIIQKAADEVVGKNIWECFPESRDTVFYHQCYLAKTKDRSIEFEVYYEPTKCWGEVRAFPQADGLAVYVKDITSKKAMEIELNKQRVLLSTLMAKGADMVGIIDANAVYKYISPNVERIFGYKPEELMEHPAFELIHSDDHPFVFENLQKAYSLTEVLLKEFRFKHKDGKWRWVEVLLTNMLNDKVIEGILINSRDITERKHGELKLLDAMQSITIQNEKLKEIAFIQSHELRRPVANILGLAELIPSINISEDDRNILDMLKHVAADLDRQIRNVVALSQRITESELVEER